MSILSQKMVNLTEYGIHLKPDYAKYVGTDDIAIMEHIDDPANNQLKRKNPFQ